MSEFDNYYNYLRKRSILGYLYRKYWLYPKICREIKGKVLDVGCGIGDMLSFRANTTGVDINPSTVEHCRKLGLDAKLIKNDQLPFEDSSFDGVILDNVMEHIENPNKILFEISRVLVADGKVIVGVPGKKGFAWDSDHKKFYDVKILKEVMSSNGFLYKKHFFMPFSCAYLDDRLRQYCLYSVFDVK